MPTVFNASLNQHRLVIYTWPKIVLFQIGKKSLSVKISAIPFFHKKKEKKTFHFNLGNFKENHCKEQASFDTGKPGLVIFIEKVIDIPRNQQQGFKKGRGTATDSKGTGWWLLFYGKYISRYAHLYTSRSLYINVAMASVELSAAFEVVDVKLLIKRMKIMGIPDDIFFCNWS